MILNNPFVRIDKKLLILILGFAFESQYLSAAETRRTTQANSPVTQSEFKKLITVFKNTVERVNLLEKKVSQSQASRASKGEEVLDLNSMNSGGAPAQGVGSTRAVTQGGAGVGAPGFKVYFDLNLVNRPGVNHLTFQNYHSLFLFEMMPSSQLEFSFDINPSPRYYELKYRATPSVEVRAGKIWIPFDDLNPHNVFGGRANVSKISQGIFLPDLWTDLGVAIKYQVLETRAIALEVQGYVVNGFGAGGSDPMSSAPSYPSFGDISVNSVDNNSNKALGTRVHMLLSNRLGLGASYYRGQWSDERAGSGQTGQNVSILGVDTQLRFSGIGTEIRAAFATMNVDLFNSSFVRGGAYAEIGQKFGPNQQWKLLLRGGAVQLDNRVIAVSDQQIVGATLLYQPGMIQYSIEQSFDLKKVPNKNNYSYTALRMIVAL